ncbi:MAG: HAD family hydrolase [Promethearchaeota archaeon]|jgi:beta-phosphoglucomutase-like phosphatase (HAD superfamily)
MITKELFKLKKIVIFDLDGTVVRLTVDWESLKHTLSKKFISVYSEDCSFKSVSECLSKVVEKNDIALLESFFEIILQFELENIQKTQPIDEIIYFINNFSSFGVKKNVKSAILSLNMRETIIKSLEIAKVEEKIDYIVGREDVRHWKPHPEGLLKIKHHFNAQKEEMIYFGDKKKDILTGKNSGIDAFWINDLIKLIRKKEKVRNR